LLAKAEFESGRKASITIQLKRKVAKDEKTLHINHPPNATTIEHQENSKMLV